MSSLREAIRHAVWRRLRWGWPLVVATVLTGAIPAPVAAGNEFDLVWLKPATPAPTFTLPSLSSEPLALSHFAGNVVLLNFWATWCVPCRAEMPSMERLYQRYRAMGLKIVAISSDRQRAAVPPYVAALKLSFSIALDPLMDVSQRYTARALPSSFLIDKSGRIAAFAVGPRNWDSPEAHAAVERLLK